MKNKNRLRRASGNGDKISHKFNNKTKRNRFYNVVFIVKFDVEIFALNMEVSDRK